MELITKVEMEMPFFEEKFMKTKVLLHISKISSLNPLFFKILPLGIWVKKEIFTPVFAPKDDCSVGRDALEEAFTAVPAVRKMEIVSVDQTILGLHFKPKAAFILAP